MKNGEFIIRERYLYILVIIFSIFILFITSQQVQEGSSQWLPYFSICVVLLTSIISLIMCFIKEEVIIKFPKNLLLKFGAGILLYILYVYLIELIGFYALSGIFILTLLFMLRNKNLKSIILVSVITPLVLYLLLDQLLGLRMPSGFFI